MILKELIGYLEGMDPGRIVEFGFGNPHSYRGYYSELAFEPVKHTTVAEMLKAARSAIGCAFQGWKGGDFEMGEYSEVYLAEEGSCGPEMTIFTLHFMLGGMSGLVEKMWEVCE